MNKPDDIFTHYRTDAEIFDYFARPVRPEDERRRRAYIVKKLQLREDMRLADLGSGNGWLAMAAADLGLESWAADLSPQNLERIKKQQPLVSTCVTEVTAPVLPGVFDRLAAIEVLEHLPEPDIALANWYGLVAPGGKLLVTVPYAEYIVQHLCIHCNQKTPANAHLHRFTKTGLRARLTKAGFRQIELSLFQSNILTRLNLNRYLAFLPQSGWEELDSLLISQAGKAGYIAALCTKEA